MGKEYIEMLVDSLKKKEKLLTELLELTNKQTDILSEANIDWDEFGDLIDSKDTHITEINRLDEGFETLFARVKGEIESNKNEFIGEIATMKVLIKSVSEKGAEIEVVERRNKSLIENKFNDTRKIIKQSKLGSQAAAQYYQRMNKINIVDPQMMDKKS